MNKLTLWTTAFLILVMVLPVQAKEAPAPLPQVPAKGMVTMLDLGAKTCIPCKLMAPIMEKLKKEYDGRASIVFIDVWEHHDQVKKYGIKAIPTQIFFDEHGKEVFRNVGFMSEEAIVKKLEALGVSPGKKTVP